MKKVHIFALIIVSLLFFYASHSIADHHEQPTLPVLRTLPVFTIDPCCGEYNGVVPGEFRVKIHRVRYHNSCKSTKWRNNSEFKAWVDQRVPKLRRRNTYLGQFWGPKGTGKKFDGTPYYDLAFNKAPTGNHIRHIMLFSAGQQAFAGSSGDAISTGQKDGWIFKCQRSALLKIRTKSLAGQIISQQPRYDQFYGPENTLLLLVFKPAFGIKATEVTKRKILRSFENYLAENTNNFKNVETIWFAGVSRGGALCHRLGARIRKKIIRGETRARLSTRFFISGLDSIPADTDDPPEMFTTDNKISHPDGTGWANKCFYNKLYPSDLRPNNEIQVNEIIGCGLVFHGAAWNRSDFDDRWGFYSQKWLNWKHSRITGKYQTQNAEAQLTWFFNKVGWSNNFQTLNTGRCQ